MSRAPMQTPRPSASPAHEPPRAPPGLAAAALALWAATTDRWLIALLLAIVIEGARWVPLRIAISDRGFGRLAIATRLVFVAMLGVLALRLPVPIALLTALGWTPVVLALVTVPQVYCQGGIAPINVLRMFRAADRDRSGVDLTFPFVGITLLAAAGSTRELAWFYPALCAIAGWGLYAVRPGAGSPAPARTGRRRRGHAASWVAIFLSVCAIGFGFHTGLSALQGQIEERAIAIMDRWLQMRPPLDRARTRIGDVGRVKLADNIVLRVKPTAGLSPPFLVRDGAFSRYDDNGLWTNRGVRHERLGEEDGTRTHDLHPEGGPTRIVGVAEITARSSRSIMPMPLPESTTQVTVDPTLTVLWNRRGGLYAENPPPVVRYQAAVGLPHRTDGGPTDDDLDIPARIAPVIDLVFAEAGLAGLAPRAALSGVRRFFRGDFRYTTWLGDRDSGGRSLGAFLTAERAGHCEYFAAATTLLLRRAGIPARYATGFSVEEWSDLEAQYVVRARHGHAWAIAWIDGRWVEVDTTPSEWLAMDETSHRSMFEPITDLWAWVSLRVDELRAAGRFSTEVVLPALVALAALALLWRMRGRVLRVAGDFLDALARGFGMRRSRGPARDDPQAASPFAPIERHFSRAGRPRAASESLAHWTAALAASGRLARDEAAALERLVSEWYALRFGPLAGSGSGTGDAEITRDARRWLAEHRRRASGRENPRRAA